MLHPRESRELRIVSSRLVVSPTATVSWTSDVAGNTVATAAFAAMSDSLVITSDVELELQAPAWPVFDIAAAAVRYPFRYAGDDAIDLGPLALPQYPDPQGRLRAWAASFVMGDNTDTLSLLKDLGAGVSAALSYQDRESEGTQTPVESLARGWGSCRDFAVLFVEAARTLGFGARIVSGYLCNPGQTAVGSRGSGSTHAWSEIFLPGAGWIAFDPTNRRVGGANLIPVAVVRDIGQAAPVAGSFVGANAFAGMEVEVSVTS